jgi:hypothetical protein
MYLSVGDQCDVPWHISLNDTLFDNSVPGGVPSKRPVSTGVLHVYQ